MFRSSDETPSRKRCYWDFPVKFVMVEACCAIGRDPNDSMPSGMARVVPIWGGQSPLGSEVWRRAALPHCGGWCLPHSGDTETLVGLSKQCAAPLVLLVLSLNTAL
jgi:hypothetical protein